MSVRCARPGFAAAFSPLENEAPLRWLRHYGVQGRCLLGIRLLIRAEPMRHGAVRAVVRLRDATRPWVLLLGAAVAWSLA